MNLADSMLCGDLLIRGLTEQFQELVTYFDAEIIGVFHNHMLNSFVILFLTGKAFILHW